jgi:hypothetical protein
MKCGFKELILSVIQPTIILFPSTPMLSLIIIFTADLESKRIRTDVSNYWTKSKTNCQAQDFYQPLVEAAQSSRVTYLFISLLWTIKKLLKFLWYTISDLFVTLLDFRNAGFDPAVIRVDPYGNVLYFHADKASPLAWEIDHWFPCPST